jgi:hypothetical protein
MYKSTDKTHADKKLSSRDAYEAMPTGEQEYPFYDGQMGNNYLKVNKEEAAQRKAVFKRVGSKERS